MKKIIGEFEKQIWDGNDQLVTVGTERFEATETILSMGLEQILDLEDCQSETDEIGQRYVEHHGPFSVYITESICDFFDVTDLSEVTEEMLAEAKDQWKTAPAKLFKVTIQRVSYASVERSISARSEYEARIKALEIAGDIDFSDREYHADYNAEII